MPPSDPPSPATIHLVPAIVAKWGAKHFWGGSHFQRSPSALVAKLPLRPEDRVLLRDFGLPTGPEAALHLALRFEGVDIEHQPRKARLLLDTDLERGPHFPKTGHPVVDTWIDLSGFVVLGEAPNDFGPGTTYFLTRYVCVDCVRGGVWWVRPKLREGKTDCMQMNSSLPCYLASLLAYKEFREEWGRASDERDANDDPEDEAAADAYQERLGAIHKVFLDRLRAADPEGVDAFWYDHAWNESILMNS